MRLALCAAFSLALLATVVAATEPTPNAVKLQGGKLTVDGAPFKVKGMAYSPVPVGESVHFTPHGDYFTPDYVYIWSRDLPLLKSMGVNTLRIYAWANDVDHTPFLDAVAAAGLKVMLTHYVGSTTDTPVDSEEAQQAAIDSFVAHVERYGDHPAILFWSFGNELNGNWNGFAGQFSQNLQCNWQPGCTNVVEVGSSCFKAGTCMYTGLLGWINKALAAAKAHTTRPLTSTFADVDMLISGNKQVDKLPRFDEVMKDFDFYAMQVYRGSSMASFFQQYNAETSKPLLIGEYGIDAMNDPCGWPENHQQQPCFYNTPGQNGQAGGADATQDFVGCTSGEACAVPGVQTQMQYDSSLTNEVLNSAGSLGGILMEWHDENWKNIGTQDHCETPCPSATQADCYNPDSDLHKSFLLGGSAGCTYKAHVSCSNYDTAFHDVCGYALPSAPDGYVNEAWFGVNSITDCGFEAGRDRGHRHGALAPRPVVQSIKQLYGGSGDTSPPTCDSMRPCWSCALDNTQADIAGGACNDVCGLTLNSVMSNPPDGTVNKGAASGTASATPIVMLITLMVAFIAHRA